MEENYGISESDFAITDQPSENEDQPIKASEISGDENSERLFTYTASGKQVEEPLETVLKRASMGYNYAQHMNEFKSQRAAWEESTREKEARIRELEQKWSPYESYAKENPEWAEHVRSSWENRTGGGFNGQQSPQSTPEQVLPQHVRQELDELRSFRDEFKGFRDSMRQQNEDHALKQDIDSTVSEYKNFDFSRSDPETGKTLEYKILEHMQRNGINSFKAAFRDLMFDEIVGKEAMKAKEEAANAIKQRNQEGFVAESKEPAFKFSGGQPKARSYFDLVEEGGRELGMF